MIEVSALLFTLLAEGAALLSLILIIWIVLFFKKKGKDKVAAHTLVKNIKANADDRLERIKTFISQSAGLEGDELQLDVKKLDRLEKDFFSQLVRLYIKRDGDILSGIDEQFDKVISAYKGYMQIKDIEKTPVIGEDALEKLESLQKEKDALVTELEITKATMGNMMTEFNTMFSGGNETVQISKEALQTSMAEIEEELEEKKESASDEVAPTIDENDVDIDDILFEEAGKPEVAEAKIEHVQAEEAAQMDSSDIDDILMMAESEPEPSAPTSISDSDNDFGEIVSIDDVDDLLDGIDLSKEIDVK